MVDEVWVGSEGSSQGSALLTCSKAEVGVEEWFRDSLKGL